MRWRFLIVAAVAAALLVGGTGSGTSAVSGLDVTYTLDADFDQGTLVNVNHDAPNNDQLQLNTLTSTFPFIWVALSVRCTIAKVDTSTGAILGEYRTIADGVGCNQSSRTTVGLDGSVWVGHRGPGGVTHVGLSEASQCIDRNGNSVIDTSTGYGDVKAWPGGASDVSLAQDECIVHHVDTNAAGLFDSRHMSIDAGNNLWVGDFSGGRRFIRINGSTGAIETAPRSFACGGYGGLIDGDGVIWSANGGGAGLLRWDPNAPDSPTNPRCVPVPNVYGLAVDGNGWVWVAALFGNAVWKVSPDGTTILGPFGHGSENAQGLAVAPNGDVWVSSSLFCGFGCTVGHLLNDGTFVGNVPTDAGSTGVSVDAAGKVWITNLNSNNAQRIDPSAGPIGGGGVPVGAVDLSVPFPAGPGGRPSPFPYNYSDMTGAQLLGSTSPQGTWTVVQDGGFAGVEWTTITWNAEPQGHVPAGASITVEARTAESEAGLGSAAYAPVSNGVPFVMVGRYIQVRATLTPNDDDESPVLSDIRIQGVPPNEDPDCSGATAGGDLWPPNHKYVDRAVTGVTDPDGDPIAITITGITQDEPVDALGNGDGNTSPDAVIGAGGAFQVRAERAGGEDGRVYRISFTGDDGNGGTCSGMVTVGVPHDQGGQPVPIDSAPPSYDSTTP